MLRIGIAGFFAAGGALSTEPAMFEGLGSPFLRSVLLALVSCAMTWLALRIVAPRLSPRMATPPVSLKGPLFTFQPRQGLFDTALWIFSAGLGILMSSFVDETRVTSAADIMFLSGGVLLGLALSGAFKR